MRTHRFRIENAIKVNKVNMLILLFMALSVPALAHGNSGHLSSLRGRQGIGFIKKAVQVYGNQTKLDGEYIQTILLRHNREAFPLIISELHPVKGTILKPALDKSTVYYNNYEAIHMIRMIQMLQYLTGGLSFVATTNVPAKKIGAARRQALQEWPQIMSRWNEYLDGYPQSKSNIVGFYGLNDPVSVYYLAPRDAQMKIIRLWKIWYKRCARRFVAPPITSEIYSYGPDLIVDHFDKRNCLIESNPKQCCE